MIFVINCFFLLNKKINIGEIQIKIKEILNTMDEQQNMWFGQNRKLFMGEN